MMEQFFGFNVPEPPDPVIIGHVARPVGVKGEIKVLSESQIPERFLHLKELIVRNQQGCFKFKVRYVQQNGGWFKIALKGIDNPEDAALFNGSEIVASIKDRPRLPEDEYYIDDLIGCTVVTNDGEEIGFIREILSQGHHDLWVVDGVIGEVLVPAVHEFVKSVDLVKHRVTINRIEGLWEEA